MMREKADILRAIGGGGSCTDISAGPLRKRTNLTIEICEPDFAEIKHLCSRKAIRFNRTVRK